MEKMNVPSMLVVGGSGFIGHHVVKRGVEKGWRVSSVGLNKPSPLRTVRGAHYLLSDLTNKSMLREIGNNSFDYVVNLAGYIDHTLFKFDGQRTIRSHFNGLMNLVEFLDHTKLRRLVQIGSSDEYGIASAPQNERQREQPVSPYSLGKVAATHFLQMLHRTEGLPVVILRLYLTYGPGQESNRFLPQVINDCLRDREFDTSKGAQLRDFCYVEDTVEAIFQAFECDAAVGRIFNIASGQPIRIRDLVEVIIKLIGAGKPKFGMIPYRPCENMVLYGDISSAREVLHWAPETPLHIGLRVTIDSMRPEASRS